MKTNAVLATATAILTAVAATPLSAQMGGAMGHSEGGGMMGGAEMAQMSRMHAFQPMHILEHGQSLDLTDAQREALTEIMQNAAATTAENRSSHDEHMRQATELLAQPGASAGQIRQHFEAAHAAGGRAHWAQINAAIEALGVLDELQQARVRGWADMMQMMQEMHQGADDGMEEGAEADGGMEGMRHDMSGSHQ